MKSVVLLLGFVFVFVVFAETQNVAINTSGAAPNASAMLDISSTNTGLLIPRVALSATNNAAPVTSPATSLIVYNTATTGAGSTAVTPGYYFWNGSAWVRVLDATYSGGDDWRLTGNSGTAVGTNFLGTTDNVSLAIRTNNTERIRVLNSGNVGIRTTTPSAELEINGWIGRTAHNNGALVGSYNNVGANSEQSNPIYVIGANYKPNTTTLNNMYGVGYTHTNASFISNTTSSWGMYVAADGDARIWLAASDGGDSYFNAGNVGIGTTSPLEKLHITGIGTIVRQLLTPDVTSSGEDAELVFGEDHDATYGMKFTYDGGDNKLYLRGFTAGYTANNTPHMSVNRDNGYVGIGTTTPDDRLDVVGNGQISGYLKVGNPGTPSTIISNSDAALYQWSNQNGLYALLGGTGCGASWSYIVAGLSSYYQFNNAGSRSYNYVVTPWIWVPSSSNGFRVELNFENTLEGGYDGVYAEYTTNGTTWTLINSWSFQGYNDNTVSGSNNACSGGYGGPAWTDTDEYSPLSNTIGVNGSWLQVRLVGVEDGSVSTGDFRLYGLSVWTASLGSVGGAFSTGNIYAENNVYAGSNVLLGDVAEYFKVDGISKPGMLISLNTEKDDAYLVTNKEQDANVVGIHSTAPTVTINDPNSGIPVALTGRVPVYVSVENGAIHAGDYLTASSKKGYAMKAQKPCYVVGQALEDFVDGEGKILCLVKPGWYAGNGITNIASGEFFVQKGKNEIVIQDPKVKETSRIFLTMLADAGHRFWIKEKSEGAFIVAFSGEVTGDIPFDYLIENAGMIDEEYSMQDQSTQDMYYSITKPIDFANSNWQYDDEKKIYWRPEPMQENSKAVPVESDHYSTVPPATPENIDQGYIFYNGEMIKTVSNKNTQQVKEKTELELLDEKYQRGEISGEEHEAGKRSLGF